MKAERNVTVDLTRAIAIIMVVFGHVISTNTVDAHNSFIYNVIWSLQIPAFMVLSGYLVGFGRDIASVRQLASQVGKRTASLLVPFFTWTFLIRGLILGEKNFLNLKFLIFNMDAGYWFLFSLWTISVFFSMARCVSHKIYKNENQPALCSIVTVIVFVGFLIPLVIVGAILGLSFLGIKLTLYYSVFFALGYLFAKFKDVLSFVLEKRGWIAISFSLVYFVLISFFKTPNLEDTLFHIAIRFLISLVGVVALCSAVSVIKKGKICNAIAYVGKSTLEIYVSHCLFLLLFSRELTYSFYTVSGVLFCLVKGILVLGASLLLCYIVNKSKYCRFVLFGKLSVNKS